MSKKEPTKSESAQSLREAQLEWLDRAVAQDPKKRKLTQIARAAGVTPSTLLGFRNNRKSDKRMRTLSALTLSQVSRVTGLPLSDAARGAPETGLAEEAVPYSTLSTPEPELANAIRVLIGRRNGADAWVLKTRALEELGYRVGDVVILDQNAAPVAGDAVCAQVYDWQEGSPKTIWRLYDAPFLLDVRREAEHREKPLFVDNQRVGIKGVVTTLVRHMPRAA